MHQPPFIPPPSPPPSDPHNSHFRIQFNHLSKRKSTLFTIGKCPDEKAFRWRKRFSFQIEAKGNERKGGEGEYHHHCFIVILFFFFFLCRVLCRLQATLFGLLIKESLDSEALFPFYLFWHQKKYWNLSFLRAHTSQLNKLFAGIKEGNNFPITQA